MKQLVFLITFLCFFITISPVYGANNSVSHNVKLVVADYSTHDFTEDGSLLLSSVNTSDSLRSISVQIKSSTKNVTSVGIVNNKISESVAIYSNGAKTLISSINNYSNKQNGSIDFEYFNSESVSISSSNIEVELTFLDQF